MKINVKTDLTDLQAFWKNFEPLELAASDEIEAMSFHEVKAYLAELEGDFSAMTTRLNVAKNDQGEYDKLDRPVVKEIKTQLSLYSSAIGRASARFELLKEQFLQEKTSPPKESVIEVARLKLEQERIKSDAIVRSLELKLEAEKLRLQESESDAMRFVSMAKQVLSKEVYCEIWQKANIRFKP